MNPKISVVMAVYNGENYLKNAIESILNQTFKEFEFLIINDGSSDNSLKIIEKYSKDNRIKLINNLENKGLIYSLNRGIEEAKGEYIARMDCDDISYKNRFEKQLEFLEKNNEIIVLGTGMNAIFENIPFFKKRSEATEDFEKIRIKMLFNNCLVHPSVMIRREYLIKNKLRYEEKYKNAEDYGMWINIIKNGKIQNLKEPFIKYRIVKKSVTRKANKNINDRKKVFKEIYRNYFNNLGLKITEEELNIHFEIAMVQNLSVYEYSIEKKLNYFDRLTEKLLQSGFESNLIDQIFNNLKIKMYIYHNEKVNNNLNNKTYKKMFVMENFKKVIKKVYV